MCYLSVCSKRGHQPERAQTADDSGVLVAGLPSAGASFSQFRRSNGFGLWAHRGVRYSCVRVGQGWTGTCRSSDDVRRQAHHAREFRDGYREHRTGTGGRGGFQWQFQSPILIDPRRRRADGQIVERSIQRQRQRKAEKAGPLCWVGTYSYLNAGLGHSIWTPEDNGHIDCGCDHMRDSIPRCCLLITARPLDLAPSTSLFPIFIHR